MSKNKQAASIAAPVAEDSDVESVAQTAEPEAVELVEVEQPVTTEPINAPLSQASATGPLRVIKPFSWAHGGVRVVEYAEGDLIETDEADLITVSKSEGWTEPA